MHVVKEVEDMSGTWSVDGKAKETRREVIHVVINLAVFPYRTTRMFRSTLTRFPDSV